MDALTPKKNTSAQSVPDQETAFIDAASSLLQKMTLKKFPHIDFPVLTVNVGQVRVRSSVDKLLRVLKKYRCRATFFLVGQFMDRFPDLPRKIARAGCEVCNHSQSHPDFTKLTPEQIKTEIGTVQEKIDRAVPSSPRYFRFPYGKFTFREAAVVRRAGYTHVFWNIDVLDTLCQDPDTISGWIEKSRPGDIVLIHGNVKITVDLLEAYLKRKKKEKTPVFFGTVSDGIAAEEKATGKRMEERI